MRRRIDYRTAMVLAATLAGASMASSRAVEHYERDQHDSHRWDSREGARLLSPSGRAASRVPGPLPDERRRAV